MGVGIGFTNFAKNKLEFFKNDNKTIIKRKNKKSGVIKVSVVFMFQKQ